MKNSFLIITMLLLTFVSCKAQLTTNNQEQINAYKTKIIGTWVDEDDYKLVFSSNGTCKEYDGVNLITTYDFSIKNNNCEKIYANDTVYLKWKDREDSQITCFEILNVTNNSLSIMIIDRAKRLFFNKQG